MGVALVMFTQDGERRNFPITGDKATIGRNSDSDIQVSLGVVSRHHCELSVKEDTVAVRDMGSSNGTYVNNKRVQQADLHAGDTITVGPVVFTVVINDQPEEIKPVRTMLAGKKKKAAEAKPKPAAAKKSDDTGSIDLNDLGELDLAGDDSDGSASGSMAALEEISKQHKKS